MAKKNSDGDKKVNIQGSKQDKSDSKGKSGAAANRGSRTGTRPKAKKGDS